MDQIRQHCWYVKNTVVSLALKKDNQGKDLFRKYKQAILPALTWMIESFQQENVDAVLGLWAEQLHQELVVFKP